MRSTRGRRVILLTVTIALLQFPLIASAQTAAEQLQSPCARAPWRCGRRPPTPRPAQYVDALPEKVAVGLTIGSSVNDRNTHSALDRAAVIEIPIKATEWSARRLRMDIGTTKWQFDGYYVPRDSNYSPIDSVRLTRVSFTLVRAVRPATGFRLSLYRGWGAGRYYYSFRHATPSRAKTLGLHGLAGAEYITRRRVVVGGEVQVRATGTASTKPGLFNTSSMNLVMFSIQASIGLKVRL